MLLVFLPGFDWVRPIWSGSPRFYVVATSLQGFRSVLPVFFLLGFASGFPIEPTVNKSSRSRKRKTARLGSLLRRPVTSGVEETPLTYRSWLSSILLVFREDRPIIAGGRHNAANDSMKRPHRWNDFWLLFFVFFYNPFSRAIAIDNTVV